MTQKVYKKTVYEIHDTFKNLDVKKLDSFNSESKERMTKFKRKMNNIQFNAYSEKNMEKMREFGEDPNIAAFILAVLKQYEPLPLENLSQFEMDNTLTKLWATLSYSQGKAVAYFERLANQFTGRNDYIGLCATKMLLHCFRYCENAALFSTTIQKLNNYYEQKKENMPVYVWAKQLGLPSPNDEKWFVNFDIEGGGFNISFYVFSFNTYGTYWVLVNKNDHTVWGSLRDNPFALIEYYYVNDQPIPYELEFGIWESPTGEWKHIKSEHHLAVPISFDLLHIKEFITALEKRYGFKFDRKFTFCKASKGIDIEIVQRWIVEG